MTYSAGFCILQRNHSLFGSVMNALTGTVKTGLPFTTRTQSLFINHTQTPAPIVSPTNSFHGSHTKPSPRNSINGKISPSESTNHIGSDRLNVDLNNAINRSPLTNRVLPAAQPLSDESRRSSRATRYGFIISCRISSWFINYFIGSC